MAAFNRLIVDTAQGHAGELTRESQFVFNYNTNEPSREISITMPVRAKSYSANTLPGVLQQNLPEGYLRQWLVERFGKIFKMDNMNILAISGRNMIGRVIVKTEEEKTGAGNAGESLREILAWRGTEDLFAYLSERYAEFSGISGIQPKVMLADNDAGLGQELGRATMKNRGLIIKASGIDYPHLAENEFICMSIAKKAGIVTPEFWLSDNKKLFVVERFDLKEGCYLGFEDMTTLMGRSSEDKYFGSYESVAKAIRLYASPENISSSLSEFFKSVVLSVVVGNGDAHLKNFGLLYTHPHTNDCALSPLYDVVNTTIYIERDVLALNLAKTKAWPSRKTLAEFGKTHCEIDRPERMIDHISQVASEYRAEPSGIGEKIKTEIDIGCARIGDGKIFGRGNVDTNAIRVDADNESAVERASARISG